ncbi:MAG: ABC transporter ATP-binding protein [Chitinophagaceae bacterium]|nr:ABC transporter ATP-binding protein [Chitinophagaceae bacterium]
MPPLLQIKNLQVDFVTEIGTTTAVNNISFEVARGEILAIVGESGSGKSVTALSVLQLLPQPPAKFSTGEILFSAGDQTINLLTQTARQLRKIRGNQIAMIFQEPMTSLNPVFTCGDQVMEAIRLHQHISSPRAKQKTLEMFEKVKLPDPSTMFNRYPHQLSGGQKQRVMIAIAMSCHPDLLICDEPTTALDVTVQKTILELIRELQRTEQMGVIFITHDLGVVAEIADRAIVMYKGSIVEQGTTTKLFTFPKHPYTKGLLACRPLLHEKGERLPVVSDFLEGGEGNTGDKVNIPESSVSTLNLTPQTSNLSETLIEVKGLSVWYPSKKNLLGRPEEYIKAVDDISFSVYKGETLGLVGESGCGKTTLGRTLLRLLQPTSGKILYKGVDLTLLSGERLKKFRKNVQIIFQDPYSSLNPRLTIGTAISEPLKVHRLLTTEKKRWEKVIELLEKVNLKAEHFHRYPHEFSGGQRQRIVIARALALEPDFIVCDESVSALDVSVQAQVLNLLNDLKTEFGFTNIFISHDLSVIQYISDRIMVMNKGKIEEIGAASEVYHQPRSAYTQKLIASIPKGPSAA